MPYTPYAPQTVAGIEVTPLCDAVGPMGESLRRPLDETFPGSALDEDTWILHFHCFLLRVPAGPVVLVDTGLGGTGSPAATWAPVPGRLISALAEAGQAPDDIDVVVLTHLHSDHASGCLNGPEPAFRNARYLVQQAELDALKSTGEVYDKIVRPLQKAGSLDTRTGRVRLADRVDAVPTPGHTPGHQSVVIDDHRLVVAGDVVLHPVQLEDPAVTYMYDDDAAMAAATRRELLERIRAREGLLAAPHLPEPFVRC